VNRFSDIKKDGFFTHQNMFKAAGILVVLTLLSVWWVCGLFAKYKNLDEKNDVTSVAAFAQISVHEHEAVLTNGVYTLDTDSVVEGNDYPVILPGTMIPKDPFIIVTDSSETACEVYLEAVNVDKPRDVIYTINGSSWLETEDFAPRYGGTVYKYKDTLPAHTGAEITDILAGNRLIVKDSLKDKSQPTDNSNEFSIVFYAYLVQAD